MAQARPTMLRDLDQNVTDVDFSFGDSGPPHVYETAVKMGVSQGSPRSVCQRFGGLFIWSK